MYISKWRLVNQWLVGGIVIAAQISDYQLSMSLRPFRRAILIPSALLVVADLKYNLKIGFSEKSFEIMKKTAISACIIAFNEEGNIQDCLESLKWVDEIVVVDSYSTDQTFEIAKQHATHCIQRSWPGHIAQKNKALEYATHEWVLSLDADERISPALRIEIEEVLQKKPLPWDGFYVPRQSFYLQRWIRHGGWQPDLKLRLFKKSKGRWGGKDPHDKVILDGKSMRLKNPIYHYNYRDLSHQLSTIDSYSRISSTEVNNDGKKFRLSDLLLRPPFRFLRDYFLKQGFRDGLPGLIIAVNTSFFVFIKYAKLWELQKKNKF